MTSGGEQLPRKAMALNGKEASQVTEPPGHRLIAKWPGLAAAPLAEESFGQRACALGSL